MSLEEHFNGGHNDHTNEVRGKNYAYIPSLSFLVAFTPYSLPLRSFRSRVENTRARPRD
jgi:hypothetical protein